MSESHETVGVYVHIPFCERVCPYCDFAVVAARTLEPVIEADYVAALRRELAVSARKLVSFDTAEIHHKVACSRARARSNGLSRLPRALVARRAL